MAAAPGAAAPPPLRSFADILSSSSKVSLNLRPPERFKGMPAVSFSDQDIQSLSQRFKFALIGKFVKGRPSMALLKKAFDKIGFAGHFTLGLLEQRHVLINFDKEDDYQRCWLRKAWSIQGYIMRIFKWTPDFRPDVESPVVPVWICFEGLPVHLQDKQAVFSIANLIGTPLKADASTLSLNRPSVARVCVELDVSKPIPDQVWIHHGSCGGFSQSVKYEHIPPYCSLCSRFDHLQEECRNQLQPSILSPQAAHPQVHPAPPKLPPQKLVAPPKKIWRPITEAQHLLAPPHQTEEKDPPVTDHITTKVDNISSPPEITIPDSNLNLGLTLIDDHGVQLENNKDTCPGHMSDGEDFQRSHKFSRTSIESWKEASRIFTAKLSISAKTGLVAVTARKRKPLK